MAKKSNSGVLLPSMISIDQERAKRSLFNYVQDVWHIVEPTRQFLNNWHIEYMCDYLQAVTRGEIRNLIINVPPGSMKSLLTGVFWPTWEWTFAPETRWLTGSYAYDLAVRDSVKSRQIIRSAWYQERWGDVYKLSEDQNAKDRYNNNKTGYRIAFSVGGLSTGERATRIVVDDPLKALDATSSAAKNEVISWWGGTMGSRDDSAKTSRVIIMQRLAEDDLTGFVLDQMDKGGPTYEHLCLPMEYEPHRYVSGIDRNDPRTEPGELLWKERFPKEEVERLKFVLGDEAPGQLQQRPTAKSGAIFQRGWWTGEDGAPRNRYQYDDYALTQSYVARYIVYDTALKDGEQNDYTARAVGDLLPDYRLALRYVGQDRLQFPQLIADIESSAAYWQDPARRLQAVVIEDKVSGTSAIQTIRQTSSIAHMIRPFTPKGSKEYRARAASVWCERGCVLLPEHSPDTPWLYDFEDGPYSIYKFPRAAHDDMVDAFSMLILYCEYLLAAGWQERNRRMG